MLRMDLSREELAQRIADKIEDCRAKVWIRGEKVRVYLSQGGKSYGHLAITNDGVTWALSGYANNRYGSCIHEAIAGVTIIPDSAAQPMGQRLTPDQADILARQPRKDCPSDTVRALDSMYGPGGWDDRDREDYEG